MLCNLFGAVVNVFLDALFVSVLQLGMEGAAIATIVGQFLSGGMTLWFLSHCRTVKICSRHLKLQGAVLLRVVTLGMAPCSN